MSINRRFLVQSGVAGAIANFAGSAQGAPSSMQLQPQGLLRLLLVNFKESTSAAASEMLTSQLGEGPGVIGFLSKPNTVAPRPNGYSWGTVTAYQDKAGYEAAKAQQEAQLHTFANYDILLVNEPFQWVNPKHTKMPVFDRHFVLIRFKDGVDADRQYKVTEYIKSQVVGHPNIQSYVAGPNLLGRSGNAHFDWLSATTFPSAEDHRLQQDDPVRQKKTAVEFLPYADVLNFDCIG